MRKEKFYQDLLLSKCYAEKLDSGNYSYLHIFFIHTKNVLHRYTKNREENVF